MDVVMTEIIKILISFVCLAITYVLTAYVIPFIRSKMSANAIKIVNDWSNIAVKSVEQVYGDKSNEKKKEIAFQIAKSFLERRGITRYLTDADIDALIESAVKSMKIEQK